ncbi:MAG: hypothetical protein ACE5E8_10280, partial [Acidimicrobiia bacterium]
MAIRRVIAGLVAVTAIAACSDNDGAVTTTTMAMTVPPAPSTTVTPSATGSTSPGTPVSTTSTPTTAQGVPAYQIVLRRQSAGGDAVVVLIEPGT